MKHYENRAFRKKDGSFNITVLPGIMKAHIQLTRYIKIMDANEVLQVTHLEKNKDTFWLYPFGYFSPKDIETGRISATRNT